MTQQLTPEQLLYNTERLLEASKNGETEEVKRLISVSDPKAHDSQALQWAAEKGHIEIVKLLIPVSDPTADGSRALWEAAQYGYNDIVKLLIPVSDPKKHNSFALRRAVYEEYLDTVRLLIPVSDCNSALNVLQSEGNNTTLLQQCMDEYEVMQQQERLRASIEPLLENNSSAKRKM